MIQTINLGREHLCFPLISGILAGVGRFILIHPLTQSIDFACYFLRRDSFIGLPVLHKPPGSQFLQCSEMGSWSPPWPMFSICKTSFRGLLHSLANYLDLGNKNSLYCHLLLQALNLHVFKKFTFRPIILAIQKLTKLSI